MKRTEWLIWRCPDCDAYAAHIADICHLEKCPLVTDPERLGVVAADAVRGVIG